MPLFGGVTCFVRETPAKRGGRGEGDPEDLSVAALSRRYYNVRKGRLSRGEKLQRVRACRDGIEAKLTTAAGLGTVDES